jgi:benzoylformate decarboxylase
MPDAHTANTIFGRSAFIALLKDEGVSCMFGNPGTTELPIMHALGDHPDMGYVLGLQESIVIGMADGYARASGKLAACNVHVAPGLGNAIGAIYTAQMTGTPMIVTAGQQEQGHGLTEPLLYAPLVPIAQPVVKWATEVTRIEDLPRIMRRAAKVAMTAPSGPVFISLPGDILNAAAALDLGESTRVDTAVRPSDAAVETLAKRLLAAKRPAILAGPEIAASDALVEASRFAEALGAPVWQQTVPYGAHFLSEHPAFMGALSRDQKRVRDILAQHDLLVCIGADLLRMSVWSEVEPLPPGCAVVQIGLRDWEMGKNYPAEIALRADVRETLAVLVPALQRLGGTAQSTRAQEALQALAGSNWSAQRSRRHSALPAPAADAPMSTEWLMMKLVDGLPGNAIVVDEGITSSTTLLSYYAFRDRYAFFGNVSGGIGWAIAAAVGVQLARPERRVVAVIGDGSAMYSVQALWSAAHYKLPVIFVIANNGGYQILKNRLKAFHGNDKPIGMDLRDPPIDFSGLARSFGLKAVRIERAGAFDAAWAEVLATQGPVLVEAVVQPVT